MSKNIMIKLEESFGRPFFTTTKLASNAPKPVFLHQMAYGIGFKPYLALPNLTYSLRACHLLT